MDQASFSKIQESSRNNIFEAERYHITENVQIVDHPNLLMALAILTAPWDIRDPNQLLRTDKIMDSGVKNRR